MRDDEIAFEDLVKDIFYATDCDIINDLTDRFDLVVEWEGEEFVAEIKYYRTMRAQVSLINRAISQLQKMKNVRQEILDDGIDGLLIISSYLEPRLKSAIEEEEDIKIVDLSDLIAITSEFPDLREKLVKLLEIPDDFLGFQNGRSIDKVLTRENRIYDTICRSPEEEIDNQSIKNLITKLNDLPLGKKQWKTYEVVMIEILKYLFEDDLKGWYTQYCSNNTLNRYDCVCGVKKNTELWVFIVEQLKSNYILLEFKNHTSQIGQGEVLTTEKYLFENAFRKVALIFSRKGANLSALEMCMGAMRESGRLILILDDDDVRSMLEMKDSGSDPSDYLLNKVDNFLMRLSR